MLALHCPRATAVRFHRLILLLILIATIGCTDRAVREMGGGGVAPDWDAAGKFAGEDGFLPVAYAAEKGNWASAKQIASSDQFDKAVKEFADSPVPKEWE